ncbi:DUF1127 domain-containing protein [Antarcticirhabdus aurantiaca]|uniref:DUF1127 domain-containing protein n=1 Tax=Antarcticirhabdus aurantiaca TaxID=2606717 RepID=A0ACD4NS45_9HYPH|nr:DUF1127 domain-containing protein [Antarcticirhabdus aurantiaca]WAJ29465.1 DUF1127 domain-containing protein [Jeongeuplla avenae]
MFPVSINAFKKRQRARAGQLALSELSDYLLRDIGLTRNDVRHRLASRQTIE